MSNLALNKKDEKERTKPTISVVAICRNEEVDLPGFLANLLPWVDEIIIVDDGSTDNSLNILHKAGPKVKLVEQVMDAAIGFAGQRNRGIEEASSVWLLHMDIDERVPPALADEILSAIRNEKYTAYRYRRQNFFLNRPMRGGGFQDWNNPQLARRGKHYFENIVHENCVIEGTPDSIGQLQQRIWHLNDESYKERIEKSLVYCQNQAKLLISRGIKIKWYHLLLLPFAEFLRKFILKHGYSDGIAGFIWALHCSDAMFRACALAWDEQNFLHRASIEEQLHHNGKE